MSAPLIFSALVVAALVGSMFAGIYLIGRSEDAAAAKRRAEEGTEL